MAAHNITDILDRVFDTNFFSPHPAIEGKTAIPYIWDKGTSRLVLVQGENAGGKSFFRRIVRVVTHKDVAKEDEGFPVTETIGLSMEARTGDSGMMSIVRSMVFGDESHCATGTNTAHTVDMAIKTAQERTHSVIVYWDEPDIGMAASSAMGAGIRIREFVDALPDNVEAVFVTSHSPHLVAQLLKAQEKPHYVFLGSEDGPKTAQEWVAGQLSLDLVPKSPTEIKEIGHARRKMIQAIINEGNKA